MTADQMLLQSLDDLMARKRISGRRSDLLADEMYRRMAGVGIRTTSREKPYLPKYFLGQDEPIPEVWWQIGAGFGGRPLQILPSVLVAMDGEFYDAYYGRYRRSNLGCGALWTGPIRVHGPGWPNPDPAFWVDAHVLIGVCAVSQQPEPTREPGSLRCWRGWHQSSAQTYLDQQRGEVVADCRGTNPGHNRAYVFRPGLDERVFDFRFG